jgi:hypothetical protein
MEGHMGRVAVLVQACKHAGWQAGASTEPPPATPCLPACLPASVPCHRWAASLPSAPQSSGARLRP